MADFFQTDWAAMTLHDWIGTIITVVVFVLMVGLYIVVFLPRNRDHLEAQRHLIDGDESRHVEDKQ